MTDEERFLIFISQFNLSLNKINDILNNLDEISIDGFVKARNLDVLLKDENVAHMKESASDRRVSSYFANLKEKDIKVITKFSEDYPEKLLGLDDAPYYLFCKGDLSLLNTKSIGIVGTRTPTNYGRIITDRFAGELAGAGVTIISGLAYGVDSIAHRKALEVGGKTIAVLGSGFNYIYPSEHTALANEIAEKGLLISEYCPSIKATRYTFPQRNRIVAGLSDGILITEAGVKSGTVHTKDFALDYGKTVFAVPGNITSEMSALTNDIIVSGQGQGVVDPKYILEELGISDFAKKPKKVLQLGIIEGKIVEILKNGEKDIDFISENCNLNINSLNSYLTTMEISGIIRRMPGGYYSLT